MDFRIADTFTASLAKLTGDEQKAVKTTAFDLQLNPAKPGMSFHKLGKAKDKNFWSVRVNDDIRLIVHRTQGSLLLCYVDHHDKAYAWAEKRKLETHPKTGAAQLVEIRETYQEILIPVHTAADRPKPPLFANTLDETLLGYGVPAEWLDDIRKATEDNIFELTEHLPQEAAEALLDLATGSTPKAAALVPSVGPFDHPDAQRRFRVVENVEELERALDFPWDRWTVFLHPSQREIVERQFNGAARVSGSAGTGKTVVALHRAVHLARSNPDSRVLLTTYSDTLANALRIKLRRLIGGDPRLGERIEVRAIDSIARRLYERTIGPVRLPSSDIVQGLLTAAIAENGIDRFSEHFLHDEWAQVVDAWQVRTWDAYRGIARLGRKTRLPERQRADLWRIFEKVLSALSAQGFTTQAGLLNRLAAHFASHKSPFEFVVVDESQDLTIAQLRFLASLGADVNDRLFFAGDLGQRIFQQPFSWKSLGVDIRGRSSTLRINYRTSHQIRAKADRLLGPEVTDVDGNEERRHAISIFNGPSPEIRVFETAEAEAQMIAQWLAERRNAGVSPGEMAIFVRSDSELSRAADAAKQSGIAYRRLDEAVDTRSTELSIGTMHLAKGLEFRAVVVMACDDEVLPLQERIASVADDSDLEEVYNTERHLLYVACTRARDQLMVSGVSPESEYLDDLRGE